MTKYFPLLLILASCHSTPKVGEVWQVEKPFQGTVTIDSINRFGNICFHDDSQGTGICYPGYFEGRKIGEVKAVTDPTNFIYHSQSAGQ